ncbi:MAG: hypothetical protein ABIA76_02120 [Candidatus Diapherotrites archaeon]
MAKDIILSTKFDAVVCIPDTREHNFETLSPIADKFLLKCAEKQIPMLILEKGYSSGRRRHEFGPVNVYNLFDFVANYSGGQAYPKLVGITVDLIERNRKGEFTRFPVLNADRHVMDPVTKWIDHAVKSGNPKERELAGIQLAINELRKQLKSENLGDSGLRQKELDEMMDKYIKLNQRANKLRGFSPQKPERKPNPTKIRKPRTPR